MAVAAANSNLDRDQFLKLLTTQLRSQNPLDPLKDQEFVAQLAQFSTLEGVEKLNANFSDLLLLQQMTQGANLVGRSIVYQPPGTTTPERGVVESIHVQNGKLQMVVKGKDVPLDQLRGVEQSGTGK